MSIEQELQEWSDGGGPCCNEGREIADLMARAKAKIERLTEAIEQAAGKLSCVAIERGCSGVPEIVRVCDEQALGILLESLSK